MENADDTEIMNLCRSKLKTFTAAGKESYTKANNAFNFYQLLKMNGWEDVKGRYSPSQFNRNVKSLCDIGIPKALLQNLNNDHKQVIPMVDLVQIDFSNQFPDGYSPPISNNIRAFDRYLNRNKPKL
ncbi:phage/plasmid replication protein, II/X family, partial [Psychrobacter sp. Rd 27.2]|uniref:phage/plasmid replication protein, II/X family n=1 Tax=Psychrobacter sp. Rd 27.2 TaxID=1926479 RepID=UPI000964109F